MVMESGQKMCEKITIDMVVAKSWESLEFRRIIKEVEDLGTVRMNQVELELKDRREEREAIVAILLEEEARSRRLQKKERVQKAWSKSMEARKYLRMVTMMDELAIMHEEMAIDDIEQRVLEMMEMGVEENDDVQAWEVDTEGDQIMP